MIIPWMVNRNDQAITLKSAWKGKVGADPKALKPFVDAAKKLGEPLTFAMTFPPGTHALWIRYYLAAGGINADKDVSLITLPPPQMVANMKVGKMDGFCVGEPWNARAIADNIGFTSVTAQDIWKDHPEKVCAFTAEFAAKNPKTVKAILKGRHDASVWLDDPANRSVKEVNHVEFALADSDLTDEAGDALRVIPQKCPALLADVLAAHGCDGEESVSAPEGSPTNLRHALTAHDDLGQPSADLPALCATAAVSVSQPSTLISQPFAPPHHVIDAILAAATKPAPAALIPALKKIQPRLYSISSSPKAARGQVHLTVRAGRYEKDGRARKGVCSTFLAERALAQGTAGVFVHSNKAFRPPASGHTPMIMVGPGTGIAPFRAFLTDRAATGAKGKNWLFFGDQRASTDFLYRDELTALQSAGVLTRLDLAFSRDQPEKIYVQQRMAEAAAELWSWLESGAHFYVGGDASRMAKDVDAALHQVVETAGKKSPADAYVQSPKSAKRYQRDVY